MMHIDKDIPIPAAKRASKYPFADMEIGDSFFAEGVKSRSNIQGVLIITTAKMGFHFTTRAENGGLRIWRTA